MALEPSSNLILIGFPRAGKTTLGKRIARQFQRPFVDTDYLLEERQGMPVKELYQKLGEEGFRQLESQVICDLRLSSAVIVIGGGGVIASKNQHHLRRLGYLVYLATPLPILKERLDRNPLRQTTFDALYHARKDLYESLADTCVVSEGELLEVSQRIFHAI